MYKNININSVSSFRDKTREKEVDPRLKSAITRVAKIYPEMQQDKVAWDLLKKLKEHKVGASSADSKTASGVR